MILRKDITVTTTLGTAVSGCAVYVLTQPANLATLTPLATIYANSTGTALSNPFYTDGQGNGAFYADNTVVYTIVYFSSFIQTIVQPDQNLGNSPSSTSSFGPVVPTGVIDGNNQVFTLPVVPTILFLSLNGVAQTQGLSFNLAGNTITYAVAPQVGDTHNAQGLY